MATLPPGRRPRLRRARAHRLDQAITRIAVAIIMLALILIPGRALVALIGTQ